MELVEKVKQDYLVLRNLMKIFGSGERTVTAVDDVNLEVKEGELVTLLGPSGCGKTTTLRMISGFELPTSGEILIDGENISMVPPNKRPTTMVFQNYALFPHMTVYENIAYGLKIRREPGQDVRRKTEDVMRLVGLEGMGHRSPAQLSGGQQQRVSLARSLIMEPKVLLLDEPTRGIDVGAKSEISEIINRLAEQNYGVIFVSSELKEVLAMSDRILVMCKGKITGEFTHQEATEEKLVAASAIGLGSSNGGNNYGSGN